jgi:hypothetical protein
LKRGGLDRHSLPKKCTDRNAPAAGGCRPRGSSRESCRSSDQVNNGLHDCFFETDSRYRLLLLPISSGFTFLRLRYVVADDPQGTRAPRPRRLESFSPIRPFHWITSAYTLLSPCCSRAVRMCGQQDDACALCPGDTPRPWPPLDVERINAIVRPAVGTAQGRGHPRALADPRRAPRRPSPRRQFEALEELPGVGHKTASVVMVQAFGYRHSPRHPLHRLAARWRMSDGTSVAKTERDLTRLYPREAGQAAPADHPLWAAHTARPAL